MALGMNISEDLFLGKYRYPVLVNEFQKKKEKKKIKEK